MFLFMKLATIGEIKKMIKKFCVEAKRKLLRKCTKAIK